MLVTTLMMTMAMVVSTLIVIRKMNIMINFISDETLGRYDGELISN